MSTTQFSGNQIRPGQIGDTEVDATSDVANQLKLKKVITRRATTTTTGTNPTKNVSSNHLTDTAVTTASSDEGILTDAPGNTVKLVLLTNRQVPRTATGEEVYARMTESIGVWTLSFYYINKSTGIETAYAFVGDVGIEYRYTQRTNLFDADEFDFVPPIPDETGDILAGAGAGTIVEGDYTAAGGAAVGDFVYVSGSNEVSPANATSIATAPAIGLAVDEPVPGTLTVVSVGEVDLFAGLTAGATYFLSEVDGDMTTTPPTGSGKIEQALGVAKDADTFLLLVDRDYAVLTS